jgi:hypothetical protein
MLHPDSCGTIPKKKDHGEVCKQCVLEKHEPLSRPTEKGKQHEHQDAGGGICDKRTFQIYLVEDQQNIHGEQDREYRVQHVSDVVPGRFSDNVRPARDHGNPQETERQSVF